MAENIPVLDTISVIYEEEEVSAASKDGLFAATSRLVKKIGSLNVADVAINLEGFCKQIGNITKNLMVAVHGYHLESLELSVDITAKGEVRLIASASSEIKGGLKLVFKKLPASSISPEGR